MVYLNTLFMERSIDLFAVLYFTFGELLEKTNDANLFIYLFTD